MKQIYIYGASGHGKVVCDIAKLNKYDVIGFVDDDEEKNEFNSLPCIRFEQLPENASIALGIGNARVREIIAFKLKAFDIKLVTLIHPSSVISKSASLEDGCVVMAQAVINADAKIGKGVIVNSSSVVEHDCVVDDFAHICPKVALAGNVKIGKRSWIGIGSTVIQGVVIADDVTVGAGAVVVKDINDSCTVVGIPAKVL